MNSQQIRQRFQLFRPEAGLTLSASPRSSAVVLPLIDKGNTAHVLLCKRPVHLNHHPGEICLPGGTRDPGDLSLVHTALRELDEELAIASSQIELIGTLPEFSTLTGFTISPFVGILASDTRWQASPDEVEEAFLLPVNVLANEQNWLEFEVFRRGRNITLTGFHTPYGLLWGATARIIRNFTRQLALPV